MGRLPPPRRRSRPSVSPRSRSTHARRKKPASRTRRGAPEKAPAWAAGEKERRSPRGGQGLGLGDGQASSRQATPPFGASRGGRGTHTGTGQLEHATMRALPQQVTLVFDGGCGVCTRSVRAIKSLDRRGRITAVPYQKPGVPASAGLTAEACRRAAWAVTPDGHRYGGAGAVNVAAAVALGTKLPFAFYRLPLIGHAQDRVYDWIAANRRRLPGDEPHCSQHPGDCA
jgi:predicted DCC family thiol-disulfide oxidoreductase YuxK